MLFPEFENKLSGRAILLSVKPRFAEQIALGKKTVEVRRVWPSQDVSLIVVYSSAPTQRLIALAAIEEVIERTPRALWSYSKTKGVGLSRAELLEYFEGKEKGFAVSLKKVWAFQNPVQPKRVFSEFIAPQSFRYLSSREVLKIFKLFENKG